MTTNPKSEIGLVGEPVRMSINVYLSTGAIKQHIIALPPYKDQAFPVIDFYLKSIYAAVGRKIGCLILPDPSRAYNTSEIVLIEYDYLGPEEWKEGIKKLIKTPIGLKR